MMISEDAYNIICDAFGEDKTRRITNSFLDIENFGNFVIEVLDEAGERAIICDRDQIYVCADSSATKDCRTLVESVFEATEQDLMDAIQKFFAVLK